MENFVCRVLRLRSFGFRLDLRRGVKLGIEVWSMKNGIGFLTGDKVSLDRIFTLSTDLYSSFVMSVRWWKILRTH